jgi:hypothetical protein
MLSRFVIALRPIVTRIFLRVVVVTMKPEVEILPMKEH